MVIFTRLFAISMVARRVLGFSFSKIILLLEVESSSPRSAISFGDKEKNAISLPEIRAEDKINMAKKKREDKTPLVSKAKDAIKQKCKMLEGGSVSNFYFLVIIKFTMTIDHLTRMVDHPLAFQYWLQEYLVLVVLVVLVESRSNQLLAVTYFQLVH